MSLNGKERKLLMLVGFLLFVFALSDNIKVSVDRYNQEIEEEQRTLSNRANGEISWGVYEFSRPDYLPIARFTALFVFPFLYWSRKFSVSILLTFSSFLIFGFETLWRTRDALNSESHSGEGFVERLFVVMNPLDYLVFLLITLLLVWQASIHFRAARQVD